MNITGYRKKGDRKYSMKYGKIDNNTTILEKNYRTVKLANTPKYLIYTESN